jgi:hypothetical protein
MSEARRAEIEARLAKATPGSWAATDARCSNVVDILRPHMGGSDDIAQVYAEDELTEQQRADADFIAHAPDDIRDLLADGKVVRAERDALYRNLDAAAAQESRALDALAAAQAALREAKSLPGEATCNYCMAWLAWKERHSAEAP